ncbi:histidinol-phosphatase [Corynebacterium pseudokroppenstedtii]|uniref:histidinol-phosphatase n=1 Tax=Corynebacterium pseudokroppenstedtii TaxID=2804917 RepID=UPI00307ABF61
MPWASSAYGDDVDRALRLADAADAITMKRFLSSELHVSAKPDMTPVSDADLDTERTLRRLLTTECPDDEVLGEEFGGEPVLSGRQWVIDPIDGTKNYVRGVPVWATLISLMVDGYPHVGVVSAPALGRRWIGITGEGAWALGNGTASSSALRKLSVSTVSNVDDSSISMSSLEGWKDRGLRDAFVSLTDDAWRLRGFGDFYSYCLVAEGAVDIAAEPEVSLWDLAALVPVVEGAGGTFTSLAGEPGPHGGDALATNGLLHETVRRRLTDQG